MPFVHKGGYLATNSFDGQVHILLEPLRYVALDGTEYIIPAGSETDGYSTPRQLWPEFSSFGIWDGTRWTGWWAAILHDWLYRYTQYPKDLCDNLLLEAMLALGVPYEKAMVIYEGVHLKGWHSFEQDRLIQKLNQ